MYFVDRERIEMLLAFLEKQLASYREIKNWEERQSKLALERIIQTSIDAVLDTGNAMIDGFIMRDPGSFEDIIDILLDEKVITNEMAVQFKHLLPLRKKLIQDYLELDFTETSVLFEENLEAFVLYPRHIRTYLLNELGPVSAFKN